jgi:hypothetical protein
VTTHGFSKEYKLTLDASDVGVGVELQFVLKTLTKISKAIMMYISSIRDAY